jgi:hypothetical protein
MLDMLLGVWVGCGAALAQAPAGEELALGSDAPDEAPPPAAEVAESALEPIALVISGGISQGVYLAGQLYVLTEHLKLANQLRLDLELVERPKGEWEAALAERYRGSEADKRRKYARLRLRRLAARSPDERARLKAALKDRQDVILTGASAGAVSALASVLALTDPEPLHTPEASPFFTVWMQLGVDQSHDSMDFIPQSEREESWMLSLRTVNGMIDDIEARLDDNLRHRHSWRGDIRMGLTTTRLHARELPTHKEVKEAFAVEVPTAVPGGADQGVDELRWVRLPCEDGAAHCQERTPTVSDFPFSFTRLAELVKTSGAFPVAFAPLPIDCATHDNISFWGTRCSEGEDEFLMLDGGVFDNNPVRLALELTRDFAPGAAAPEPDPDFNIIFPDPDIRARPWEATPAPPPPPPPATGEAGRTLLAWAAPLVGVAKSQALADYARDHGLDNVDVLMQRTNPASSYVGAFLGFYDRSIRAWDFYAGMYDAMVFIDREWGPKHYAGAAEGPETAAQRTKRQHEEWGALRGDLLPELQGPKAGPLAVESSPRAKAKRAGRAAVERTTWGGFAQGSYYWRLRDAFDDLYPSLGTGLRGTEDCMRADELRQARQDRAVEVGSASWRQAEPWGEHGARSGRPEVPLPCGQPRDLNREQLEKRVGRIVFHHFNPGGEPLSSRQSEVGGVENGDRVDVLESLGTAVCGIYPYVPIDTEESAFFEICGRYQKREHYDDSLDAFDPFRVEPPRRRSVGRDHSMEVQLHRNLEVLTYLSMLRQVDHLSLETTDCLDAVAQVCDKGSAPDACRYQQIYGDSPQCRPRRACWEEFPEYGDGWFLNALNELHTLDVRGLDQPHVFWFMPFDLNDQLGDNDSWTEILRRRMYFEAASFLDRDDMLGFGRAWVGRLGLYPVVGYNPLRAVEFGLGWVGARSHWYTSRPLAHRTKRKGYPEPRFRNTATWFPRLMGGVDVQLGPNTTFQPWTLRGGVPLGIAFDPRRHSRSDPLVGPYLPLAVEFYAMPYLRGTYENPEVSPRFANGVRYAPGVGAGVNLRFASIVGVGWFFDLYHLDWDRDPATPWTEGELTYPRFTLSDNRTRFVNVFSAMEFSVQVTVPSYRPKSPSSMRHKDRRAWRRAVRNQ